MPSPPKLNPKQWIDQNKKAGNLPVRGPRPGPYPEFYDPSKFYQQIDEKGNVVDKPYISYTMPSSVTPTSDRKAVDFQYPNYTGYKLADGSLKYLHNTTGEEMPGIVQNYWKGGKIKGYAVGGTPGYLEGNNTVNNLTGSSNPTYKVRTKGGTSNSTLTGLNAIGYGLKTFGPQKDTNEEYGTNQYFENRKKDTRTGEGIASAVGTIPVVGAFKGIADGASNALAPQDAYGVSKSSDAAIIGAGFLNPLESTTSAVSDIRNGKVTGKTAANLLAPGLGRLLDNREKQKQRDSLQSDQESAANQAELDAQAADEAAQRQARIQDAISKRNLNLKDGGKVTGKGTGTSDSIKAEVDEDSFIVPAKNEKIAEAIRKKILMKPPTKAKLKGGDTSVKLSDGEHLFTEDEVADIKAAGINLNALAPDAKSKLRNHMNCGGKAMGYASGGNIDYSQALDYGLPLLQAGIGLNKLNKLGKRPVDTLDPEQLGSISSARQNLNLVKANSKFGYTPEEMTLLNNQNQALTAGQRYDARALSGGSSSSALNNERVALIDSFNRDLGLRSSNRNLMLDKQNQVLQQQSYLDTLLARKREDKRRIFGDKLNGWNIDQQAGADLVNSGLSNLVGASRYRNELSAMNKRSQMYNSQYPV